MLRGLPSHNRNMWYQLARMRQLTTVTPPAFDLLIWTRIATDATDVWFGDSDHCENQIAALRHASAGD